MRWLSTPLFYVLLAGCSGGADPGPIRAPRVVSSLLEHPELRTVEREHAEFGVRVDIIRPRRQKNEGGLLGALPAIELTPPAVVRFALPELPAGAQLDFAMAVLERATRARCASRSSWTASRCTRRSCPARAPWPGKSACGIPIDFPSRALESS